MSLTIFQSDSQPMTLMQTSWATEINPVLKLPINSGQILKSVSLVVGTNSINHLLGRKLQGWFLVRQRALAEIYDAQDSNLTQAITLALVSDAVVTVDIFVF